MSDFAKKFMLHYPQNPKSVKLDDGASKWNLTLQKRFNEKLNDEITYNPNISFSDYFIADKSDFLDRRLKSSPTNPRSGYIPYYLLVWAALSVLFLIKKKTVRWLLASLFLISSYGLILGSTQLYGWVVYYGPVLGGLGLVQSFLVLGVFAVFYYLKPSLFSLTVVLTFGLDALISRLRYTQIAGSHFLGIAWDDLRLIGLKIQNPFGITLFNQDFPNEIASSFLKFDFDDIWSSPFLSIIIYPAVHVALAFIVYRLIRKSSARVKMFILGLLVFLFALHLNWVVGSSPRVVIPAI